MSNMAEMAAVYERVKAAVMASGDVVSKRDYERLAKCCAKMVEILEICVHRSEAAKDMSFARDIRIYLNIVRDLLDEPFFEGASFKIKEPVKSKEQLEAEWQAYVDGINKRTKKKTGPKSKYTPEEQKARKREYQRLYQKKLRDKLKARRESMLTLQSIDKLIDVVSDKPPRRKGRKPFLTAEQRREKRREYLRNYKKLQREKKKALEAKQQRTRKAVMTAAVKAKLKQFAKDKKNG